MMINFKHAASPDVETVSADSFYERQLSGARILTPEHITFLSILRLYETQIC